MIRANAGWERGMVRQPLFCCCHACNSERIVSKDIEGERGLVRIWEDAASVFVVVAGGGGVGGASCASDGAGASGGSILFAK